MTASTPAPALVFDDFDTSVRIQDDLYRHVNGGWLARTEIPADKPMTGSFVDLRDRAEAAVRDIITSIAADRSGGRVLGSDEQKIADLYASFMDEEAIERAGAAPLADGLAESYKNHSSARKARWNQRAWSRLAPMTPPGPQTSPCQESTESSRDRSEA